MNISSQRISDVIVNFFIEKGINQCFCVTGGGAMFLNDGVAANKKLNAVCCHHEQACSMAAVGYSKYKNGLSAVMLTTGCGSTNAITGLLDAWQDNTPVILRLREYMAAVSLEKYLAPKKPPIFTI